MTLISALFIDFDNVTSSLQDDDDNLAARFANRPLDWLGALETQLALPDDVDAGRRRIVSRRCYASPQRIHSYRRNFTQTGFEVIDCPPLTAHMKNSADIYMVMDVVDYLTRYPHIEEFIILSADADFVPVLNRLRREMKRSAIFAAANISSAYRNCADRTIDIDFFANHLAPNLDRAASAFPPADLETPLDPEVAEAFARCLTAATAERGGRLPFATAAHALLNGFPHQLGKDWGGRRSFTAMLAAVDLPGLEVDWTAHEITGDVALSLPDWPEADQALLGDFVGDVVAGARKRVPLLPPGGYTLIFEELARYYQGNPLTFTDAVDAVVAACAAAGVATTAQEVRFIGTGISLQGYRFGADARAAQLASLWRLQLFYLCDSPDWMREPDEAERVAAWCHAANETIAAARDDFLAQTADEPVAATEV